MDWIAFVKKTPQKISVPRFKGAIGSLFGFRQRYIGQSTTLVQMVRPSPAEPCLFLYAAMPQPNVLKPVALRHYIETRR